MKELLRQIFLDAGACKVGFAKACAVDEAERWRFAEWLAEGRNAGMGYMHNYPALRFDPTEMMEGAKTVVSLAFNYNPAILRNSDLPMIARFAYGEDYHKALRKRLRPVCRRIEVDYGCHTRICIDSAPVMEKYWALKSGVALKGRNSLTIVEGIGSYIFLAEVLLDIEIEPDEAELSNCLECGECMRNCPTGALQPDGTVDSRRCLSYLTVEHQGEWPAEVDEKWREATIFGCDRCQQCCPYNLNAPAGLPEFSHPNPDSIKLENIANARASRKFH